MTQKNRQNTHKTYSTGLKFCRTANCYTELNELDQNCHSTVALTLTDLDDSCVTTVTGSVLRSDLVELSLCFSSYQLLLSELLLRHKELLPSVFLHEVWTACPS